MSVLMCLDAKDPTHPFGYSPLDNGIQANKGTAQYEQHVRRINLVHVRFR